MTLGSWMCVRGMGRCTWVRSWQQTYSFSQFLLLDNGTNVQVRDCQEWTTRRKIETFFDALYFSVVTQTTVGFGDITPFESVRAKLVFAIHVVLVLVTNTVAITSSMEMVAAEAMSDSSPDGKAKPSLDGGKQEQSSDEEGEEPDEGVGQGPLEDDSLVSPTTPKPETTSVREDSPSSPTLASAGNSVPTPKQKKTAKAIDRFTSFMLKTIRPKVPLANKLTEPAD